MVEQEGVEEVVGMVEELDINLVEELVAEMEVHMEAEEVHLKVKEEMVELMEEEEEEEVLMIYLILMEEE